MIDAVVNGGPAGRDQTTGKQLTCQKNRHGNAACIIYGSMAYRTDMPFHGINLSDV